MFLVVSSPLQNPPRPNLLPQQRPYRSSRHRSDGDHGFVPSVSATRRRPWPLRAHGVKCVVGTRSTAQATICDCLSGPSDYVLTTWEASEVLKSKKFTREESIGFDEVCAMSLKPILTLAHIVALRSAMEAPALLVLRYSQGTGEFKLGVFLWGLTCNEVCSISLSTVSLIAYSIEW